jgi:hypothetical protein
MIRFLFVFLYQWIIISLLILFLLIPFFLHFALLLLLCTLLILCIGAYLVPGRYGTAVIHPTDNLLVCRYLPPTWYSTLHRLHT